MIWSLSERCFLKGFNVSLAVSRKSQRFTMVQVTSMRLSFEFWCHWDAICISVLSVHLFTTKFEPELLVSILHFSRLQRSIWNFRQYIKGDMNTRRISRAKNSIEKSSFMQKENKYIASNNSVTWGTKWRPCTRDVLTAFFQTESEITRFAFFRARHLSVSLHTHIIYKGFSNLCLNLKAY